MSEQQACEWCDSRDDVQPFDTWVYHFQQGREPWSEFTGVKLLCAAHRARAEVVRQFVGRKAEQQGKGGVRR